MLDCQEINSFQLQLANYMFLGTSYCRRSSNNDRQTARLRGSTSEDGGEEESSAEAAAAGVVDRARLIDTCLHWSKTVASEAVARRRGHPDLHAKIAGLYWTEKSWVLARRHFLLSNDGESSASFLIEYQVSRRIASRS